MPRNVMALSLWEPWASLMRTGAKTIETRAWRTAYRGPLLICAAKKIDHFSLMLLEEEEFQRGLAPLLMGAPRRVLPSDLHFGNAVALVDLEACDATDGLTARDKVAREVSFGDYSPGRFAWITNHLRTFRPFPVRGSQGLYQVQLPADVEL